MFDSTTSATELSAPLDAWQIDELERFLGVTMQPSSTRGTIAGTAFTSLPSPHFMPWMSVTLHAMRGRRLAVRFERLDAAVEDAWCDDVMRLVSHFVAHLGAMPLAYRADGRPLDLAELDGPLVTTTSSPAAMMAVA